MKSLALAGVALAALMSPAFAEDFTSGSHIDAVTVFPRGAEVTRNLSLALPAGENRLIVNDLPGRIDASSLRVEARSAAGLAIGSVDVRVEALKSRESETRRKQIEAKIAALEAESRKLKRSIGDQNFQKDLLGALGRQAIAPKPGDGGTITAAELTQLLDVTATRLSAMTDAVTAAQGRRQQIGKELEELRREEQLLPGQPVYRSIVTIGLAADKATEASFSLRYGIADAGWRPVYDARLDTGSGERAPALDLVSRAEVTQRSGEPWANVALTLSTARITGATQAPVLAPEPLSPLVPLARTQAGALMQKAAPAPSASDEAAKLSYKAREQEAQIETAGFEALYRIAGRQTIGDAGEAKGVRITSRTMAAGLEAVAVPRLDPGAYLAATFKLSGDAPTLPGTVMIYRDGVFLGRGHLPLLNPGEEHALGFGLDDKVKVKRDETIRKSGETGIISTDNVEERAYSTRITNLHDRAIKVRLIDRMPYSTHEDIKVEMLSGMTAPDERNVDKKRGIMAWTRDLKPGAADTINFGYRVTWPKKMVLPPIR